MARTHDPLQWEILAPGMLVAQLYEARPKRPRGRYMRGELSEYVVAKLVAARGANGLRDVTGRTIIEYCAFRSPFSPPIICDTLEDAKTVVESLYALSQD